LRWFPLRYATISWSSLESTDAQLMRYVERERYDRDGIFDYGDGCNFGFFRADRAARKAVLYFVGAGGVTLYSTEVTPQPAR